MTLEELILDVLAGFDINLPTSELKTISSHLVDVIEDWMEGEEYHVLPDNGDTVSRTEIHVDGLDS